MSTLPDNASPGPGRGSSMPAILAAGAAFITLVVLTIVVPREVVDGVLRWVVAFGAAIGVGLLVFILSRSRGGA